MNYISKLFVGYKENQPTYKYTRSFTIPLFQVGFNGFTEEAVEVAQQTFKLLEEEGNTLRYTTLERPNSNLRKFSTVQCTVWKQYKQNQSSHNQC